MHADVAERDSDVVLTSGAANFFEYIVREPLRRFEHRADRGAESQLKLVSARERKDLSSKRDSNPNDDRDGYDCVRRDQYASGRAKLLQRRLATPLLGGAVSEPGVRLPAAPGRVACG